MKEFKYTTSFSSVIKALIPEDKDKYLAMASLVDIGDFIPDIDTNKDIIALWFFKDRGDKFKGTDIELNGKIIAYTANTFFITPGQNKFKINKRKKWTFNRTALQLDLNIEQWKDLLASV